MTNMSEADKAAWARSGAAFLADVTQRDGGHRGPGIWLTWPPFDHIDGPVVLLSALKGGDSDTVEPQGS